MNARRIGCKRWICHGLIGLSTALVFHAMAFELVDGRFSEIVNQDVRSGKIIRVVVTTEPVSMLDLDALLLAGKFNPGEAHPQAQTMVAPEEGRAFVLLTFEIKRGLSLGRYDYQLSVADESHTAKAIGVSGQPFDPRVWEVRAESGLEEVQVLFDIPLPASPTLGLVRDRLGGTVRERTVSVPIGRERATSPPPPEADPDENAEAEAEAETEAEAEEGADAPGEDDDPAAQAEEPEDDPAPVEEAVPDEPPAPAPPPEAQPPARQAPAAGDLDDVW